MSIVKTVVPSDNISVDLANQLGQGVINTFLSIIWLSYSQIIRRKEYALASDEDTITEDLYYYIQSNWHSKSRAFQPYISDIIPDKQHMDASKAMKRGMQPHIDLCFRGFEPGNYYFGIEAKKLIDNDNQLIERYIRTGIENYTTGRYGSGSSKNAILGYILSGDVDVIVNKIKKRVSKSVVENNLAKDINVPDRKQYISRHNRETDNCIISIYHLFLDFG
jgi:hypothetical protein